MFVLHQKLSRHVILSPVYSFKEQCILGLIIVYLAHILLAFLPGGKKKKKKKTSIKTHLPKKPLMHKQKKASTCSCYRTSLWHCCSMIRLFKKKTKKKPAARRQIRHGRSIKMVLIPSHWRNNGRLHTTSHYHFPHDNYAITCIPWWIYSI